MSAPDERPVAVSPEPEETMVPERRIWTVALLVAAVVLAEVVFWLGDDAAVTPWWVSIVPPLFFFIASARCLRTAIRLTSDERRSWV